MNITRCLLSISFFLSAMVFEARATTTTVGRIYEFWNRAKVFLIFSRTDNFILKPLLPNGTYGSFKVGREFYNITHARIDSANYPNHLTFLAMPQVFAGRGPVILKIFPSLEDFTDLRLQYYFKPPAKTIEEIQRQIKKYPDNWSRAAAIETRFLGPARFSADGIIATSETQAGVSLDEWKKIIEGMPCSIGLKKLLTP